MSSSGRNKALMDGFNMKEILIQAVHFVGISGIGWVLDFVTYTCLGLFSGNLALNNTVSSWVGVTFVFVFATRRVFQNSSKLSLKLKYVIYLVYQVVLIFLISKLLNHVHALILEHMTLQLILSFSAIISKILVTPITMILNFIVMKSVIEKL